MNSYYYIDDNSKQQFGPFPLNELRTKRIMPITMVWCAGMEDWKQADSVDELQFLFNPGTQSPVASTPNSSNYQPQQQQQYQQRNTNTGYSQQQPNSQQSSIGWQQPNKGFTNVDVRPMPKNWLLESILCTVLCCLPLGVIGIVYASKVETKYYEGDYDGAVEAAKNAKLWTLIGVGSIFAFFVIYMIFVVILGVSSSY